ncbi:MAG: DUF4350 domain-containing protein [Myxococcota bacterium]
MGIASARPSPRVGAAALACALAATGICPGAAAAQKDYAAGSRAWNGLSRLSEIAAESGIPLRSPAQVDLSDLQPADAIVVVYPTKPLPTESLAGFMRAGGRVVVADDFGEAAGLLRAYGIRRHRLPDGKAPTLRGNANLPLATPHERLRHPLTQGVKAVVTNHPAVLVHPELEPLLTLGGRNALVLIGAVGAGRLVSIGDPSVLINNMLQFRGNRAFAGNLLRYVEGGQGGTVWLVANDTPLVGRFGQPGEPLGRARSWLSEFATAEVPPLALMLASLLLVALLVLVASSSLPRQSPYEGASFLPGPARAGGFLGRIAFFRDRPAHLLHPLLVYKFELEGELVRRLGLRGRPLLRDVVAALRRRGIPEADVRALRDLMVELDHLRQVQDRPPGPPRIGERRFRRMVHTGERILGMLPPGKEQ